MPYYVRINGRSHGPFDESKLMELKSKGTISRTTEVSENDSDWYVAETFEFLYSALPTPPSPQDEPETLEDNIESNTPMGVEFRFDREKEYQPSEPPNIPLLSRHSFIFLAITVGMFGVHDFYAKRNDLGVIHIVCLAPWIFLCLYAAFASFAAGFGVDIIVDIIVDWFVPSDISITEVGRTIGWQIFLFIVLPVASYVMAMFEIVLITKDGVGREFER